MIFNYKDWFSWVNFFTIMIFILMYKDVIPTLKRWSWGYWSYEYLLFTALLIVYFLWYWFVSSSRKLNRIETKINRCLELKEGEQ